MTESTESFDSPKKGNGAYIAIIVILLLVIGFMFYLLSSSRSHASELQAKNEVLEADMEGMNEMLSGYVGNMSNDLKTDFKNMLSTYDALLKENGANVGEINEQKARIQELQDKLDSGQKLSARQLYELRKENETLRKIMIGYVKQIDELNTKNLMLEYNLDSTSTVLKTTKQDRDRLESKTIEQDATIGKAKKLQAYSFNSGALRSKLNSTTVETTKARGAVQLMSSFTLSENTVTSTGTKTVYMQITDPNGKIFQSRSSNITSTESGDISYTDKKDISYTGERVDVAIYYDLNGQDIDKGTYKVKIFCQGQLIGTDSFSLK